MAKWKYTIDFSDIYRSEEISIQDKANLIGNRITNKWSKTLLNVESDKWSKTLEYITDLFLNFQGDNLEEFDDCMENLYDWADQKEIINEWPYHRGLCWIKTTKYL